MTDAGEIERAVADFARGPNGGVIVTGSALTIIHRDHIYPLRWQAQAFGEPIEQALHVAVGGAKFQRAPALIRKAFMRPRFDPLPRPPGRPASPALVRA